MGPLLFLFVFGVLYGTMPILLGFGLGIALAAYRADLEAVGYSDDQIDQFLEEAVAESVPRWRRLAWPWLYRVTDDEEGAHRWRVYLTWPLWGSAFLIATHRALQRSRKRRLRWPGHQRNQ